MIKYDEKKLYLDPLVIQELVVVFLQTNVHKMLNSSSIFRRFTCLLAMVCTFYGGIISKCCSLLQQDELLPQLSFLYRGSAENARPFAGAYTGVFQGEDLNLFFRFLQLTVEVIITSNSDVLISLICILNLIFCVH